MSLEDTLISQCLYIYSCMTLNHCIIQIPKRMTGTTIGISPLISNAVIMRQWRTWEAYSIRRKMIAASNWNAPRWRIKTCHWKSVRSLTLSMTGISPLSTSAQNILLWQECTVFMTTGRKIDVGSLPVAKRQKDTQKIAWPPFSKTSWKTNSPTEPIQVAYSSELTVNMTITKSEFEYSLAFAI